jgi:hypothetical protein
VSAASRFVSTLLGSHQVSARRVGFAAAASKPNFDLYQLRVYPTLVVVYHGRLTILLNTSWTQMELWPLQ